MMMMMNNLMGGSMEEGSNSNRGGAPWGEGRDYTNSSSHYTELPSSSSSSCSSNNGNGSTKLFHQKPDMEAAISPVSPGVAKTSQCATTTKRKKIVHLEKECWVCGASAADHIHYGAICCYSCRAFFRRSCHRTYLCIKGDNSCQINAKFRKYCKKCRYRRCLDVGMQPELVDASLRNREADIKSFSGTPIKTSPDHRMSPGSHVSGSEQFVLSPNMEEEEEEEGDIQDTGRLLLPACNQTTGNSNSTTFLGDNNKVRGERGGPEEVTSSTGANSRRHPFFRPNQPGHFRFTGGQQGGHLRFTEGPGPRSFAAAVDGPARFAESMRVGVLAGPLFNNRAPPAEFCKVKEEERMEIDQALNSIMKRELGDMGAEVGGCWEAEALNIFEHRQQQQQQPPRGPLIVGPPTSNASGWGGGLFPNDVRAAAGQPPPLMAVDQQQTTINMREGDGQLCFGQQPASAAATGRQHGQHYPLMAAAAAAAVMAPRVGEWELSTASWQPDYGGLQQQQEEEEEEAKEEQLQQSSCLLKSMTGVRMVGGSNSKGMTKEVYGRVSVIQGRSATSPKEPAVDQNTIPLKKRNCTKMCKTFYRKYLLDGPVIGLTWEEKRFIEKRVVETRIMVSLVQAKDDSKGDLQSFNKSRKNSFDLFQQNSEGIFGKIRSTTISEMSSLGLLESRFLTCAITSIGVRLFGGNGGGGSDTTMVPKSCTGMYSGMLMSPWACSLEDEQKVIRTLQRVGAVIGSDEKLEVLFTTCIMRGFRDPRAAFMPMERGNRHTEEPDSDGQLPQKDYYEEPGHPNRQKPENGESRCSCEDPNLLSGVQFSLLMHRYLKDCKSMEEASQKFRELEALIHPLYEAQHIFYYGRLPV